MGTHIPTRLRVSVSDAIESMVYVLGREKARLLLCSTVDSDGFIGPSDCFCIDDGLPAYESLFERPIRLNSRILFGSSATGSVVDPATKDIELCQRLVTAGQHAGVEVVEHVIVNRAHFRLMRQSVFKDGFPA